MVGSNKHVDVLDEQTDGQIPKLMQLCKRLSEQLNFVCGRDKTGCNRNTSPDRVLADKVVRYTHLWGLLSDLKDELLDQDKISSEIAEVLRIVNQISLWNMNTILNEQEKASGMDFLSDAYALYQKVVGPMGAAQPITQADRTSVRRFLSQEADKYDNIRILIGAIWQTLGYSTKLLRKDLRATVRAKAILPICGPGKNRLTVDPYMFEPDSGGGLKLAQAYAYRVQDYKPQQTDGSAFSPGMGSNKNEQFECELFDGGGEKMMPIAPDDAISFDDL